MRLRNHKAIGGMCRAEHRALLRELILDPVADDGAALDIVLEIAGLNGELCTDGECLDLIGDLIDVWRGINSY